MPPSVLPYLWLLASLAALLVVQRRMQRHLQGLLLILTNRRRAAFLLYAGLFLPGVALHEASHWLLAKLLFVRTRGFSLRPVRQRDGTMRLGYVEVDQVDPLRRALIGAAPLAAGSVVLALVGFRTLGLDGLGRAFLTGTWAELAWQLRHIQTVPLLGLWLYLALAVSNSMLPSAADRSAWLSLGVGLLAVGVLFGLSGTSSQVLAWIRPGADALARSLAGVFTLSSMLDLVMILPLWLATRLAARLTGRDVVG